MGPVGRVHRRGETWLLVNEGTVPALDVHVEGLTELDRRRLSAAPRPLLAPGEAVEFTLVSRLTLSGPANVVVTYRLDGDGAERRRVLQVPSA
ncbi:MULTISPECIES: hypothetical protein [Microbacterium]|uniref:hypothetical protein n=1 Tax=Microbacterium TaxID=33882 RepID=UPI00217DF6CF|nr:MULTISPECIES: hypothetical protein [Microbacterium]UWF76883.1 hypothetical protein JSY13_08570 [Microbacterium neungamense]WCM55039.1 hypothetical protein JRG78_08565 [Microbacterium sp. EF45047]